jgi:hypothetical protein
MNLSLKQLRKIAREQRLEREKNEGKPRSKSWGGKPDNRTERREWAKEARNWR